MPSDDIVKKLYSKEDIRLELDLTTHSFNKKINMISTIFKIDMKTFHNFNGQNKNNQYTFNGVSKELIKVLLKSIDYYPIDINSKDFKKNGPSKRNIIDNIDQSLYIDYISQLMKSINEIEYNRLKAYIQTKDAYQNTMSWLTMGEAFRKKEFELNQFMEDLPIYKRIELQNEVLHSIDETIFRFLSKERRENLIHKNDELENYKNSIIQGKQVNRDYELNYLLYKQTQIPLGSLLETEWDYDETDYDEVDLLIADILKKSQKPNSMFIESLDSKNKVRNDIHSKAIQNISKLIDYDLISNNKKADIVEFYSKNLFWNKCKLNRNNKHKVLYYTKDRLHFERKSIFTKKLKTIEFNLKAANAHQEYLEAILQAKDYLVYLQTVLSKYDLDINYVGKIDSEYIRYAIEDVHKAILTLDRYISGDAVKSQYPNVNRVVRNEVMENGKMFNFYKMSNWYDIKDCNYNFDNFMVGPFIENFKRSIEKRRFNTSKS